MSIRMDEIKDPRLRARIEDALGAEGVGERPAHDDDQPLRAFRIRQSSKPLMNKLETEFHEWLKHLYPGQDFHPQGKRFRLGNGIWFKVDFSASGRIFSREMAWEVKGPHAFRGGFENLKVAAGLWPEVRWVLAWKQDGQWMTQEVLP